jgi:hypothetical protein
MLCALGNFMQVTTTKIINYSEFEFKNCIEYLKSGNCKRKFKTNIFELSFLRAFLFLVELSDFFLSSIKEIFFENKCTKSTEIKFFSEVYSQHIYFF